MTLIQPKQVVQFQLPEFKPDGSYTLAWHIIMLWLLETGKKYEVWTTDGQSQTKARDEVGSATKPFVTENYNPVNGRMPLLFQL